MMISTKGRYALRVMIDLALRDEREYVSLTDVSQRQEVSLKYLEAIVAALSKAGFVESRRGKSGGYRLSFQPENYTVADILKAVEGNLTPVSCANLEGNATPCKRAANCYSLPVWQELDRVIERYLESVTLADVLSGNVAAE